MTRLRRGRISTAPLYIHNTEHLFLISVFSIIIIDLLLRFFLNKFLRRLLRWQFPQLPLTFHCCNVIHPPISETPKNYHLHEQLFKELLHNFFEEFLEAFFPEVHHYVDFSSVKPLSEEVFTDLLKGSSKRADVVVEAKLKGEETLFIIHVESQSTYESNFAGKNVPLLHTFV